MLGSACGPSEAPPAPEPETTGGNQPPVISSLAAEQTQIHPSGTTEVKCVALDADGDEMSFEWACTGGSFGPTSPTIVTWNAPANYGNYEVTVTVEDGQGGTAQQTLTLSVVANQAPQIVSVDADPDTLLPLGSSTITCRANDPDGDKVRCSWSAGEGDISGEGDKVTWDAPNKEGTFEITVLVSDDKGGETKGYVSITVAAATRTVLFNAVQEETGTVSSDGDRDCSRTRAGDDDRNIGYRAFWSFNIYSLVGTEVEDAKLKFSTKTSNDEAFKSAGAGALGGLQLWKARYGEGGLPSFDITGGTLAPLQKEPPTVINITPEIARLVNANATRFQAEALFMKITNGDGVAQWIEWSDVTLTVTYKEK